MKRENPSPGRMVKPVHREEWRRWLQLNHANREWIWLRFHKVHTGKRGLSYGEAVEEAICFGWIDGVIQRLDEETYRQKFMPRRAGSNWSETNLRRARRMIDRGLMTSAGLRVLEDKLERYEREGIAHRPPRVEEADPPLMEMLRANGDANQNFLGLSPSLRRQYLGWVMSAKREETRAKRMRQLVEILARGGKLGMK